MLLLVVKRTVQMKPLLGLPGPGTLRPESDGCWLSAAASECPRPLHHLHALPTKSTNFSPSYARFLPLPVPVLSTSCVRVL